MDMVLLWGGRLPVAVLNGGFMGPGHSEVVEMIRRALRGPDDVDALTG